MEYHQVIVKKRKKWAQSPSPAYEQDPDHQVSSGIEEIPSLPIIAPTFTTSRYKRTINSNRPVAETPTYHASLQRQSEGPQSTEPNMFSAAQHPASRLRGVSPLAEWISQALRTQWLPTGKEMSSFHKFLINPVELWPTKIPQVCHSTFNILIYPVEYWTWVQLIGQPTQVSIDKQNNLYLWMAKASILQLDLLAANMDSAWKSGLVPVFALLEGEPGPEPVLIFHKY